MDFRVFLASVLWAEALERAVSKSSLLWKHVNLLSDKTEYGIQPQTDGYYYWKVDSKTNQGTTYGSWRLGPQGAGPGTVSVNKTDTVTNTISGSYTSVGDISASLGATIGKSQSYSVQYP